MLPNKNKSSRATDDKEKLFNEANTAWDHGDLRKAFELFMRSAELGDTGSQVDVGYFFDNGLFVKRDRKRALLWYRKAYLQGDAGAANNIATVYRELGQTKKMLWWFRRAAAMGDIDVLLQLGNRYERGDGVPKDLEKSKVFYRRVLKSTYATKDDKAHARNRLGRLEKQHGKLRAK
jgi:TPR repeat protein